MKSFIKRILFFITPIIIFIAILNFFIDPANLFTNIEKQIAEFLSNGYNVTGVYNINDRILQKEVIGNLKYTPSIIILGSSRIMLIGRKFYGNKAQNNGVVGASLEDLIAIYQLYLQNKMNPKKIVIGIDPWLFNKNNEQNRWKTLKTEYYSFFGKNNYGIISASIKEYFQLISPSYFQASIKFIPELFEMEKFKIKPTKSEINDFFTRLIDGTISYDLKYRNVSSQDVEDRAKDFINGNLYSIENYLNLSDNLLQTFEKFIHTIYKNGSEVEFLLLPYHPKVYNYLKKNKRYKSVFDSEKYIKKFAEENNIKLIGGYNPDDYDIEKNDFYDGMHLNENGLKKIILDK